MLLTVLCRLNRGIISSSTKTQPPLGVGRRQLNHSVRQYFKWGREIGSSWKSKENAGREKVIIQPVMCTDSEGLFRDRRVTWNHTECFLTNSEADKGPRCSRLVTEGQHISYCTCSRVSTDASGPISRTIFYPETKLCLGEEPCSRGLRHPSHMKSWV